MAYIAERDYRFDGVHYRAGREIPADVVDKNKPAHVRKVSAAEAREVAEAAGEEPATTRTRRSTQE